MPVSICITQRSRSSELIGWRLMLTDIAWLSGGFGESQLSRMTLTLLKFDEDTFQNGYTAAGCNNLVHEHLLRKQMKDFLKAGGQFAL